MEVWSKGFRCQVIITLFYLQFLTFWAPTCDAWDNSWLTAGQWDVLCFHACRARKAWVVRAVKTSFPNKCVQMWKDNDLTNMRWETKTHIIDYITEFIYEVIWCATDTLHSSLHFFRLIHMPLFVSCSALLCTESSTNEYLLVGLFAFIKNNSFIKIEIWIVQMA